MSTQKNKKRLRDILIQSCTKHFDIHDDIACNKITEQEGLGQLKKNINKAKAQIKQLLHEEVIPKPWGFNAKERGDGFNQAIRQMRERVDKL